MFSALDHAQRSPWLLEDCNHLMWPPMRQTGMTLTSRNTNLVVPGGTRSATSRNSKCCDSNASKLMLLNDRCQNLTISNWMSMKGYLCRLFPRRGKLALSKLQIPLQQLPLPSAPPSLARPAAPPHLQSPYRPQVPPLPRAKFLEEMLSHVTSAQD